MGIFVSEIQSDDEVPKSSWLRVGDHVLEVRKWHRSCRYSHECNAINQNVMVAHI